MASSEKKVRKEQKKRDRSKRDAAKEKRRQLRVLADNPTAEFQFLDPAHRNTAGKGSINRRRLVTRPAPKVEVGNPMIREWWDRYLKLDGSGRLSMTREKLSEDLDEEWREAIFPESVYEAERGCKASEYCALLETLAGEHRELYDTGLLWFLRSRVTHYLSIGDTNAIEQVVREDAAVLTETRDAFFAVVPMLRLAGLAGPVDELVAAGLRVVEHTDKKGWSDAGVFQYVMDGCIQRCVQEGGNAKAIARMESVFEKYDGCMDADAILLRAEMIRRLTGETKTMWTQDQLLGDNDEAVERLYLLGFEFSYWLTDQRSIAPLAADELRSLIMNSFGYSEINIGSYFDGITEPDLDKYLVRFFGFLSLMRFKGPATLIAMEHFVQFLYSTKLIQSDSLDRSLKSIHVIDARIRRIFSEEWHTFTFLDPLRTFDTGEKTPG